MTLNPVINTLASPKDVPHDASTLEGQPYKLRIKWIYVFLLLTFHIGAIYGIYLTFTVARPLTIIWAWILGFVGIIGITAGSHRLWTHRSYKATWQLRLILIILTCIAHQNEVFQWARDHRIHHKFTDTDADPYNSKRGFFFSQIGWVAVYKHPQVIIKGKTVDVSDLEADPFVMWQKKYYLWLIALFCFIIPTLVPIYFWNEDPWVSWYVAAVMRYMLSLNVTGLVNSVAHMWGMRPYDKSISPAENMTVSILTCGEGWHNYHHTFPWDYKTSELGTYSMNITVAFIEFFAWLGWASDLKTVSDQLVTKQARKHGDGSHKNGNPVWGWDDTDVQSEHKMGAWITHKSE